MLSLLYTLVKLAKSHYLLLFFVCILYIAFICLFKLFVSIFNFLLPLVVNKDVHIALKVSFIGLCALHASKSRGQNKMDPVTYALFDLAIKMLTTITRKNFKKYFNIIVCKYYIDTKNTSVTSLC